MLDTIELNGSSFGVTDSKQNGYTRRLVLTGEDGMEDVEIRFTQASQKSRVQIRVYNEVPNGDWDSDSIALTADEIECGIGEMFFSKTSSFQRLSVVDIVSDEDGLKTLKNAFCQHFEMDLSEVEFSPSALPRRRSPAKSRYDIAFDDFDPDMDDEFDDEDELEEDDEFDDEDELDEDDESDIDE